MAEIQNGRPIEKTPSNYQQIVDKFLKQQEEHTQAVFKKYQEKMPSAPTGNTEAAILQFISTHLPYAHIQRTQIKNPNILTDPSHPDIQELQNQLKGELQKTKQVQSRFFQSGNNNG